MADIPDQAVAAARRACPLANADMLRRALQAAAPHIAAAERQRILVSDETVHADGSIGPDAVPPGLSPDPAYWYRRWLFAMNMLDQEATQRISHYAGMDREIIDAACAGAAAAERERIRQLATDAGATWMKPRPDLTAERAATMVREVRPFADLLDTP